MELAVTFVLEKTVMLMAPYLIWYLDLDYKAGETVISEYSFIIAMRWAIITIFQLPLLITAINTILLFCNSAIGGIQKLADYAKRRPRAADGTFVASTSRPPGRPRKNK